MSRIQGIKLRLLPKLMGSAVCIKFEYYTSSFLQGSGVSQPVPPLTFLLVPIFAYFSSGKGPQGPSTQAIGFQVPFVIISWGFVPANPKI